MKTQLFHHAFTRTLLAAAVTAFASGAALAQSAADRAATNAISEASLATPVAQVLVDVDRAWARATVPGQKATGVFMQLTARQDGVRLVGAQSRMARTVELHEMKMVGDVMNMSAVSELPLPNGHAVQLAPGGYHIMLMGLRGTVRQNQLVPVTLHFIDGQGITRRLSVQVPARMQAPDANTPVVQAPNHPAPKPVEPAQQ